MSNFFIPSKMEYVMGDRPDVECILCAIKEGDLRVKRLDVFRYKGFIISLNLYPYNAGHVMIFPERHIVDIRDLDDKEVLILNKLTKKCLDVLDELYSPAGYNLGYNLKDASGASIPHLHLHIVPRFKNELGFIDIIAGSKIIVEDPNVTRKRLMEALQRR
jgi:ATP adenylyltransferase